MVWYGMVFTLELLTCMQSPHFECSWTDRHPIRGVQEKTTEMTITIRKGKHLSHVNWWSPCGARNKQSIAAFPRAVQARKQKMRASLPSLPWAADHRVQYTPTTAMIRAIGKPLLKQPFRVESKIKGGGRGRGREGRPVRGRQGGRRRDGGTYAR